MPTLKLVVKLFIGIPLIIVSFIGIIGTLIGGKYFYAIGIMLFLVAYFVICVKDEQRDAKKLREAVVARGMTLDYFVSYLDGGVVIDLAREKVLVGNLKTGKIFSFDEVKSIEREDAPFGGSMKFNVYINTNDFETPRPGAGFAGSKILRDRAYAKLSAALKAG